VAAVGHTATGGWLSPSQAYAQARNIVDLIRDDAARAPIKLHKVRRDDTAYNADRNIATGNPYKHLVSDLQKHGVKVELCGATAKVHGWGNDDLLPDIKVNTDAMARTTQLVQQGFVKITE
jgi:intracellular sulfur oxidation DsrE/DsrF family protein